MSEDGQRPFELVATVSVRWCDIDSLGHVNQARYHEYLEQGRSAMFGKRTGGESEGYVLARIELDHVAEIPAGAEYVEVYLRVADVGRTSVRLEHEVRTPTGTVAARGNSIMVAWDQALRGKRIVGEQERSRLLGPSLRP